MDCASYISEVLKTIGILKLKLHEIKPSGGNELVLRTDYTWQLDRLAPSSLQTECPDVLSRKQGGKRDVVGYQHLSAHLNQQNKKNNITVKHNNEYL